MPSVPATLSPQALMALYRSTLQEASTSGALVMGKLVASARQALNAREAASRDIRERDALANSAMKLRNSEADLCKRFPSVLLEAFGRPVVVEKSALKPVAEVNFDQLELMDDSQVLTSVVHARMLQVVLMAVEASLSELNALMCATLSLGAVQAERNPLRPEVYISALTETVGKTKATTAEQLDWLGAMGHALSQELKLLYANINTKLKAEGVVSAAYIVTQNAKPRYGVGRGIAQEASQVPKGDAQEPQTYLAPNLELPGKEALNEAFAPKLRAQPVQVRHRDEALLTLDRLRKLLSGELDSLTPVNRMEQFSRQFAQQFEGGVAVAEETVAGFDTTLPAALEALTEMKQVDRVESAIRQRQQQPKTDEASISNGREAQRLEMRRGAKNVAQALSLEVVSLMVENMARDPRLLAPVQNAIQNLEPALLRLSLADPRFFTDKHHAARQLLQEVTHRSLAFTSVQANGFEEYLQEIVAAISVLESSVIADDTPFERVLLGLQESWGRAARAKERAREAAVVALQNAEARNLLAEKIARAVDAHPDAGRVPPVVIDFLCGPWAQVVAQARLSGEAGAKAADQYQALISALLWSAHPELAAKNVAKLTKLVPKLLSTLREGLDSIRYPATRTSAFFEKLMLIHQQAFKDQAAATEAKAAAALPAMVVGGARTRFVENGDPWVAPAEAKSSNFVELEDSVESSEQVESPVALVPSGNVEDMPVGTWIELKTGGERVRTQLTWASPHGTLFLFTNAMGATQSMTRRTRDKLVSLGNLRMLAEVPIVDVALNAVAQAAMQNSVDSTF